MNGADSVHSSTVDRVVTYVGDEPIPVRILEADLGCTREVISRLIEAGHLELDAKKTIAALTPIVRVARRRGRAS